MTVKDLIIEHLENDFFEWCRYEYERIAEFIAPYNSTLHLSNFSHPFPNSPSNIKYTTEVCSDKFPKEKVCLLDSEAPDTLSPVDVNEFDYFLLGGILGNVDEFDFDRTSFLRDQGYSRRNLGNFQMTTDTAAIVASMIIHQQLRFEDFKFIDRPEFPLNADHDEDPKEMLIMNFRYLTLEDGTPNIDPRILELAKKDRDFLLEDLE